VANAASVVNLQASADASGRVMTYSIKMGQRMLDKVIFEQLHAEDVNRYYPLISTWHIAAASSISFGWFLIASFIVILLL